MATENSERVVSIEVAAFSDSLQAVSPSSFRCSTRSDFSSGRAPYCTWKSLRSDINWRSSIDRGAASSLHVGRSNPVAVLRLARRS